MTDQSENRNGPPLSVVIATLGGDALIETIKHLNRGTVAPEEILVCIPKEASSRLEGLPFENVRIIRTACRGQVAQRAVGFQQASHEMVLQLDDDIVVRESCVQNLVACSMAFDDVAVGPRLYDIRTGKYHRFMIPEAAKLSWFEKILFWIVNGHRGYEPGRIGRAGVNMGIPEEPGTWSDVGWLSGCCVLHRRQNLVPFDFYPFKGKAFAEDLFHSVLLKKRGVKLVRCGEAICDVDFSSSAAVDLRSFLKAYFAYGRAVSRLVKEIDGNLSCLYLFLFFNLISLAKRKMFSAKSKI